MGAEQQSFDKAAAGDEEQHCSLLLCSGAHKGTSKSAMSFLFRAQKVAPVFHRAPAGSFSSFFGGDELQKMSFRAL